MSLPDRYPINWLRLRLRIWHLEDLLLMPPAHHEDIALTMDRCSGVIAFVTKHI